MVQDRDELERLGKFLHYDFPYVVFGDFTSSLELRFIFQRENGLEQGNEMKRE